MSHRDHKPDNLLPWDCACPGCPQRPSLVVEGVPYCSEHGEAEVVAGGGQ